MKADARETRDEEIEVTEIKARGTVEEVKGYQRDRHCDRRRQNGIEEQAKLVKEEDVD